jgi:hypothetical protein
VRVGKRLSARVGNWKAAGQYHYIWLRCGRTGGACQTIRGATQQAYRSTSADVGHRLRVNVIAQNKLGSTSATSGTTRIARAS